MASSGRRHRPPRRNAALLRHELSTGDFNADGRTDLAVGAYGYSSSTGRTYIFYGDGQIPSAAASADVTITGNATGDNFGYALAAGDLNADGKTDLAVGATGNPGKAYLFYNDGSIPTTAGTADVTITSSGNGLFGFAMTSGDFNSDGKTDLAVGAPVSNEAYLFYNDGSIPTTAATADVTITGETNGYLGWSFATGDMNSDGKKDLIVGSVNYAAQTGRTYIFYNDGSIPTTAATADIIITGETNSNYFGHSLAVGDFNADGRTDLAVGAAYYSGEAGRAYIFYNDGSIPTTAGTADVIIVAEASTNYFGYSLVSGDFNADGRVDFAISAYRYSSNTGRAYIF
ncbi:MAG: FG-GAP-like repeat-containing protein, partial [Undibacterium sp.]